MSIKQEEITKISIKYQILKLLLYNSNLHFNEIWKAIGGESNSFAYHLKKISDEGLIEKMKKPSVKERLDEVNKVSLTYSLSIEGRKLANSLFKGEQFTRPIISVLIVVKKNQKILCYRRLKQPSFGYYAFPGGKLKNDEYAKECAIRKLKEDTNLECDLKLKGMFNSKTIIDDKVSYNNQIYVFVGLNPKGKLQKEFYKGKHVWIESNKIPKSKKYPEVDSLLEIVESKEFKIIEMNRYKENDTFVDFEIMN